MQKRTTVCREFSTEKHRKNFKQSVKTTVNRIREKITITCVRVCVCVRAWKSRHFSTAIIRKRIRKRTNQSFISTPSPVSRRISPVNTWNVHLILIVPGKVRNTRIINSLAASTDEFFNNVESLISNSKFTNVADNFDPRKGDGKIWTGAKFRGWKDLSMSSRPVFP